MNCRKRIFYLASIVFFSIKIQAAQPLEPIPANDAFFQQNTQSNQIKIMSYNVLNLFDCQHDENFFDYTFLPKNHPNKTNECSSLRAGYYKNLCLNLNWTPKRLRKKIKQLKKVITGHGSLPDILALQEVENAKVVKKLATALGYKYYVITEYQNRRGIDVALLFNTRHLKYIGKTTIPAPGRNPLRVQFQLLPSNEKLFIYVNHWQAQMAPKRKRVKAAKALRKDIDLLHENFDEKINTLLLGDFNVTFKEEKDVFNKIFHENSWPNKLTEVHKLTMRKYPHYKNYMPEGSYLFSVDNWQRFDRIFVSKSLLKGRVRMLSNSYRIIYSQLITTEHTYNEDKDDPSSQKYLIRYPTPYNFLETPDRPLGFSDHLPVSIILKVN